jgi:hypothetical protein
MAEPAAESEPAGPLVWRIPAYQPALLMLVLCGAAALNIYGQPSLAVRISTLAVGLACGGLAVIALRLQLVATDDGVALRTALTNSWLPWSQLDDLEVVPEVRGAPTVRLNRIDGSHLDVPPSLLQPSLPTSKQRAMGQLEHAARQLRSRRPTTR